MEIKKYLNDKRILVEDALDRYMLEEDSLLAFHIDAMRYSLLAGGKRIRPILCIATAETLSGHVGSLMAIPCALECIHTYSLIHDDLPAMDNDDLRRGKPTNHVVFGEAGAILAGDGLLTFAFDLLSSLGPENDLNPKEQLHLINIIAKAAGPLGMVGGQALDIVSENKEIDFTTLRTIHSHKTGALILASVQAGAILAKATNEQFMALTEYGKNIGLAFQIVDDLLNIEGNPESLGKAVGSDADRNKATYPSFFGIAETRKKAEQTVACAIEALSGFDQKADPLRELAKYIYNRTC